MKKIIFLSVIISLIISCKPTINEKHLTILDSLQHKVDSSISILLELDTLKHKESALHFFENLNFIQKDLKDTIDQKTAKLFSDYYFAKKPFKNFIAGYTKSVKELKITSSQLIDLKHDYTEGVIDEKKFLQYLKLEQENINLITYGSDRLVFTIKNSQKVYDRINPSVDSTIEHYQNRK